MRVINLGNTLLMIVERQDPDLGPHNAGALTELFNKLGETGTFMSIDGHDLMLDGETGMLLELPYVSTIAERRRHLDTLLRCIARTFWSLPLIDALTYHSSTDNSAEQIVYYGDDRESWTLIGATSSSM